MSMSKPNAGLRPVSPGFVFVDPLPMVSDTRKGRGLALELRRAMGILVFRKRKQKGGANGLGHFVRYVAKFWGWCLFLRFKWGVLWPKWWRLGRQHTRCNPSSAASQRYDIGLLALDEWLFDSVRCQLFRTV